MTLVDLCHNCKLSVCRTSQKITGISLVGMGTELTAASLWIHEQRGRARDFTSGFVSIAPEGYLE